MGGSAEKGEKGERELRDSWTGDPARYCRGDALKQVGERKEWLNNAHKQHCGERTGRG